MQSNILKTLSDVYLCMYQPNEESRFAGDTVSIVVRKTVGAQLPRHRQKGFVGFRREARDASRYSLRSWTFRPES